MSYWYGLSFDDVRNMPMTAITAYLGNLPRRQAESKMMFSEVAIYPHLKPAEQTRMKREWRRAAAPREQSIRPASPGVLKLMGIGVDDGRKQ